jgi:hypothetical protein
MQAGAQEPGRWFWSKSQLPGRAEGSRPGEEREEAGSRSPGCGSGGGLPAGGVGSWLWSKSPLPWRAEGSRPSEEREEAGCGRRARYHGGLRVASRARNGKKLVLEVLAAGQAAGCPPRELGRSWLWSKSPLPGQAEASRPSEAREEAGAGRRTSCEAGQKARRPGELGRSWLWSKSALPWGPEGCRPGGDREEAGSRSPGCGSGGGLPAEGVGKKLVVVEEPVARSGRGFSAERGTGRSWLRSKSPLSWGPRVAGRGSWEGAGSRSPGYGSGRGLPVGGGKKLVEVEEPVGRPCRGFSAERGTGRSWLRSKSPLPWGPRVAGRARNGKELVLEVLAVGHAAGCPPGELGRSWLRSKSPLPGREKGSRPSEEREEAG